RPLRRRVGVVLATVVALAVSPLPGAVSAAEPVPARNPGAPAALGAAPTSARAVWLTSAVPAPAAARPPAPRWADYFAQRPIWRSRSCSRDVTRMAELIADAGTRTVVECTRVQTPLAWSNLSKGSGYLQISRVRRVKAAGDTRATRLLLVNPGGPGVTADWLAPTVAALEPAVHATHDIVAVDPRGTGPSLPAPCATVADNVRDRRAPSKAVIGAQQRAVQRTVAQCAARFGRVLPQLSTLNTIRDHDLVRSVLGHQVVDFYGVSAGTWMAARYADLFPARVGRFVLDSNTQFAADWRTSFAFQPQGFQRRFERQFLPWAARRHADFGIGSTTTAVRATYNRLRSAAAGGRLPGMSPANLDDLVVEKLYTDIGFGELADELADLRAQVQAKRPAAGTGRAAVSAGTQDTVFMAIQCNDSRWSKDPASYVAEGMRLGGRFPLLGFSWVTSPCAYWPYAPVATPRTRIAKRTQLLMVQSELDPATPYEGALAAHRARPETVLVSVQDQGNHGVWLGENSCVEQTVRSYLTKGRMPARDLVCAGLPLPGDRLAYAVASPLPSAAGGLAAGVTPAQSKASAPSSLPGVSAPAKLSVIERAMRAEADGASAAATGAAASDPRLDRVRVAAQRRLAQGALALRAGVAGGP
ncbi:MAG: alpha/beta hydrolase, partial [Micrococcales bacterium]|nr:alpha/beta hydrolase [Micrococcales bacterium]